MWIVITVTRDSENAAGEVKKGWRRTPRYVTSGSRKSQQVRYNIYDYRLVMYIMMTIDISIQILLYTSVVAIFE